ncbi:hypothetical protein A3D62_00535 [Candidatus Kaiserbacteria bacterium RIFCSPHIGHO2_02_FULL_49_11]|uniref:N-acetyltransferase domain-containing protein n=1 Tax=Candidatus Kaiserbacteria bacterium RIFCSPHIGHO2_02_FULL_49_11 TaxID=1798489 RepID=A0A1F6CZA7_9BACT|nr:MAG: hypothetical protein A3D62_00535 [Candidatus Kaiserbacteria bacterium RIFCSPHIGHO2_02_FULL_49_11]
MRDISLHKVSDKDIPILVSIERSVAGRKTYSPLLAESEWREEIKKSSVYLIKDNGVVVGNISYERKDDSHAHISGLAIDPRFQNQGIARKALLKMLEELKEMKRIDLVTHPDNQAALRLYRSLGFVVESRKENYFGDGEPRLVLSLLK